MTAELDVYREGLEPLEAFQPFGVSDPGDEEQHARGQGALQTGAGDIEIVEKKVRQQGQVERDRDDVCHDEDDISEILNLVRAGV